MLYRKNNPADNPTFQIYLSLFSDFCSNLVVIKINKYSDNDNIRTC